MVDFVWLSIHGFDVWYWWIGFRKMKPSNAPEGTQIFFPYIGKTDLFGWISIPARIINTIVMFMLSKSIIFLCLYMLQQKRMDRLISPSKLKELTSRWLQTIEKPYCNPRLGYVVDENSNTENELGYKHEHHCQLSSTSSTALEIQRPSSKMSISPSRASPILSVEHVSDEEKKPSSILEEEDGITSPPIYRRPTRTGTDLLKRSLLGWNSKKATDLSLPPAVYTPYEPTFEKIHAATTLLTFSTVPERKTSRLQSCFSTFIWLGNVLRVIPMLLTHRPKPFVLLAILSHAKNLQHGLTVSYPQCIILALRNPAYPSLRSKDLVLASRILLSLHPPPKPTRWMLVFVGWATFGACSVLIIGTELTINWNSIHGVTKLDSVGQLIPFCLGVGGLFRVIYAAIMERHERVEGRFCYFGRCSSVQRMKEWKEAADGFQKCVDAFDKRQVEIATSPSKADV